MLRDTSPKSKEKWGVSRGVKYVGIVADARELGVSRAHLWKVLEGKRKSDALLKRYRAMKRGGAHGAKGS